MKKDVDVKSIYQEVEFGSVSLKLDKILTERGITTYQISNKTNIRFQTIQSLRENSSSRIDFEVLAKLCYALNCGVNDIIEYIPSK